MTWNPPSDSEINVDKPIKAVDIRRIRDLSIDWGYTSAETTITASSSTTFTHGLGDAPTKIRLDLVCRTAEHNYTIGDTINNSYFTQISGNGAITIVENGNTTQLKVLIGTSIRAMNKTTFASVALTLTSWKLIVRATP